MPTYVNTEPIRYRIEDIRSKFQSVALDNTYQVFLNATEKVQVAASKRGISPRFLTEDLGLYVSDAVLPGSSFADIEVSGDRQGITERNAFARIYDDVTLTFYVDRNYLVMAFFESWAELVNPLFGSNRQSQVMVFNYPDDYKCDITVYKFNKDRFNSGPFLDDELLYDQRSRKALLGYTLYRAWPYSISSTPISYQGSNILQLNVTFRYDRYIVQNITTTTPVRPGILGEQDLFEKKLLDATGGGIVLTGAGTLQELYEINNNGGTFGGPLRDTPGVNPRGEDVTTPPVFRDNFGNPATA